MLKNLILNRGLMSPKVMGYGGTKLSQAQTKKNFSSGVWNWLQKQEKTNNQETSKDANKNSDGTSEKNGKGDSNGDKSKPLTEEIPKDFAVLFPSHKPIFPFQTYITPMKEEDFDFVSKFALTKVGAFYMQNDSQPEDPSGDESKKFADLIAEAEQAVKTKLDEAPTPLKSTLKSSLPTAQPKYVKREDLVGLELATTYDENLNSYLSPHLDVSVSGKSFHRIDSLNDVHS
jgi:hypothetical protein